MNWELVRLVLLIALLLALIFGPLFIPDVH